MNDKLKSIGSGAFGLLFFVAMIFVVVAFAKGTAAVSTWASPFLGYLVGLTTVVALPVLILLAVIPAARGLSSSGFFIASHIYSLVLWVWSFLYVLSTWGWFAVIVGILLGGVGVIPIAMVSAVFHTDWRILGQIVLGGILAISCRLVGALLAAKAEQTAAQLREANV